MPRIAPLETPYPPEIQKAFDAIMPPGVPPLVLFTTLARNPRLFEKFRAGSLLDRGSIGFYHTASFVTNALRLEVEPGAARFPG